MRLPTLRYAKPINRPVWGRCAYCYGPRRNVNHAACWRAMGFSDQLVTEYGLQYTREDPVPIDPWIMRSVTFTTDRARFLSRHRRHLHKGG
jgi:hypothetical protein